MWTIGFQPTGCASPAFLTKKRGNARLCPHSPPAPTANQEFSNQLKGRGQSGDELRERQQGALRMPRKPSAAPHRRRCFMFRKPARPLRPSAAGFLRGNRRIPMTVIRPPITVSAKDDRLSGIVSPGPTGPDPAAASETIAAALHGCAKSPRRCSARNPPLHRRLPRLLRRIAARAGHACSQLHLATICCRNGRSSRCNPTRGGTRNPGFGIRTHPGMGDLWHDSPRRRRDLPRPVDEVRRILRKG
jgi:hypothetical protein